MTRSGLKGVGRSLRRMAVVRVLSPYFGRVIVANPMQVKAIAHASIRTGKIDAGVLAQLHASGFLLEVWVPDERAERLRGLVARCNQAGAASDAREERDASCRRTSCQSAARAWLERQVLPDNERGRDRHTSARSIAWPKIWLTSIATSPGKRLMMCKPAASDDDRLNAISRAVSSPPWATSAVPATAEAGELLRPQSARAPIRSWLWRNMGGSASMGVPMPAPCWSRRPVCGEAPGLRRRRPDRSEPSFCASATSVAIRSQPWRSPASSRC